VNLTLAAIVILSVWVIAIVAAGLVLTLRPGGAGVRFAAPTSAAPANGERQEILLGGSADALGNPRGRVRAVQVRADTRQLIAVELGGGLLENDAVPAGAIVEADGQVLSLADRSEELPVDPPSNAAELRANSAVVDADGKRVGRLRLVCFDQTSGMVTALVMDSRDDQRLVPMERVVEAGPERIVTDLHARDIASLQPFATDWDLRQQIQDQLGNDREVQRSLRIDIRDQRVRVRGYVVDRAQADRVRDLLGKIRGILELDVDLLTDADLARAIQDALAHDQLAAQAQVDVTARTGIVDITGAAPDLPTARRIETVARQVDGVEVVHNMVTVAASRSMSA
jgi:osmotically-inducible protein OsmY